jgi:hypothetical protein
MADGSANVEEIQREIAGLKPELTDCGPEVKPDLAKLEQEIKTMKPKPEPIAPPAADAAIMSAPKADPIPPKSPNSNGPRPLNIVSSPSIPASVEISPPPAPPKTHARLS